VRSRGRKIGNGQKSLEEVWQQARREKYLGRVRDSPALKKLFRCLNTGMAQVQVARALGKTRQAVGKEVREAVDCGLLEGDGEGPVREWTIAPELMGAVGNGGRRFYGEVHNFRLKFSWGGTTMDRLATDRRSGFIRMSPMRGGDRPVYWTSGRPEDPVVTIQVHPGSLLAYVANPGHVEAEDLDQVEEQMKEAIGRAVTEWARLQSVYADPVEVSRSGRLVTEPHIALLGSREGPLAEYIGQKIGAWWVDKSPQEHGDPEHVHLETKDRAAATALDRTINLVENPEVAESIQAVPEIRADLHALAAHIQGAGNVQAQLTQALTWMMARDREIKERLDRIEVNGNGTLRVNGQDHKKDG